MKNGVFFSTNWEIATQLMAETTKTRHKMRDNNLMLMIDTISDLKDVELSIRKHITTKSWKNSDFLEVVWKIWEKLQMGTNATIWKSKFVILQLICKVKIYSE